MKLITLSICLLFNSFFCFASFYPVFDTLTNPPESPLELTGATNCCEGETTTYFIDIPIGCIPNWYLNGELVDTISSPLLVTWGNSGIMELWATINCDSSVIFSDTLEVIVNPLPSQPGIILGQDMLCINSLETYTTTVGNNESCRWLVDGIIQPSDSSIMTYYWDVTGNHMINVNAINVCGQGPETSMSTTVFENPVISLGNDTSIYFGQSILLDAGNPGSVYLWSTGDTTQTITVTQTGYYSVTAGNPCGFDSDDIYVDVIVGIDKNCNTEIEYKLNRNILTVNCITKNILSITIYNVNGQIISMSRNKTNYRLPAKGRYEIIVITSNNKAYRKTILYN